MRAQSTLPDNAAVTASVSLVLRGPWRDNDEFNNGRRAAIASSTMRLMSAAHKSTTSASVDSAVLVVVRLVLLV